MGFVAPKEVSWTSTSGIDLFVEVYDWDRLVINSTSHVELSWQMTLCTGIYPCSLSIDGNGMGTVFLSGNGSITCPQSSGCASLSLFAINFVCDSQRSLVNVLQVESVDLFIYNSSFSGCGSRNGGAIIESFGNASVSITHSEFSNLGSHGSGGAINAVGGVVQVSESYFVNCSSVSGGGAISAAAYSCAGSKQVINTYVNISNCAFESCFSGDKGGAIWISGDSVNAYVYGSKFSHCKSMTTGGALSSNDEATLTVTDTVFLNNSADGLGGGALHSNDAGLTVQGVKCAGNRAMAGGGGALYWSGSTEPMIILWCSAGWIPDPGVNGLNQICTPCGAGTFQTGEGMTACFACVEGTYSSEIGATASVDCTGCPAGTFSSILMSSDSSSCTVCEPGTYSNFASSLCLLCTVGSYSSGAGSTSLGSCIGCEAGRYSIVSGASSSSSCIECDAGTFSFSGAGNCTQCRAGTYSTAAGATSPAACIMCAAGQFSSAQGANSSGQCSACPAGTYSVQKYFTYELVSLPWIEAELSCASLGGHLASIDSYEENLEVLNLVKYYHDYWIGYHYNSSLGSWTWVDGTKSNYDSWGEENPKQGSDLFGCADFPSYPYTTANASGLLAFWPYFSENYAIYPDSGPLSGAAGSWYNYDCANGFDWVAGYVCSFTGSTTCRQCNTGKYSTVHGATSSDSCTSCLSLNPELLNSTQRISCRNSTLIGRFTFFHWCLSI